MMMRAFGLKFSKSSKLEESPRCGYRSLAGMQSPRLAGRLGKAKPGGKVYSLLFCLRFELNGLTVEEKRWKNQRASEDVKEEKNTTQRGEYHKPSNTNSGATRETVLGCV